LTVQRAPAATREAAAQPAELRGEAGVRKEVDVRHVAPFFREQRPREDDKTGRYPDMSRISE